MALDIRKFKSVEHASESGTHGGISVTNTASGMRIKLSKDLMQRTFLDDLWADGEKPTVQIMMSSTEMIIGKKISPDASNFRLGGKRTAPVIYSSALGRAILKRAGCVLDENKTQSFGNIRIDTLSNGETVGVITLKEH